MKLENLLSKTESNDYCYETLEICIPDVSMNIETDTELFQTLLCLYSSRFHSVKNTDDCHTNIYYIHQTMEK